MHYLIVCILCLKIFTVRAPASTSGTEPQNPSLSFVRTDDNYYELEDYKEWKQRNLKVSKDQYYFYFTHMLFACPAETSDETDANTKSVTKNSLFIQNMLAARYVKNIVTPMNCRHRYTPSVITIIPTITTPTQLIPATIQSTGIATAYGDEIPLRSPLQHHRIGYEIWDLHKYLKSGGLKPIRRFGGMHKKSGWINGIGVIFDWEEIVVKQVHYELSFFAYLNDKPPECLNYDVGKELFKYLDIQNAYHQLQDKALENFDRPLKIHDLVDRTKISDTTVSISRRPSRNPRRAANKQLQITWSPDEQEVAESLLSIQSTMPQTAPEPPTTSQKALELPTTPQTKPKLLTTSQKPLELPTTSQTKPKPPTTSQKAPISSPSPLTAFKPPIPEKRTRTDDSQFKKPAPPAKKSKPTYEYFKMQQLAPYFYMDVTSLRATTCSYLNIAPILQSIADGPWRMIDLIIDQLLYVIDDLNIIAGTEDKLTLLRKNTQTGRREPIYLNPSLNRISVPRILWKFIAYAVYPPEMNGEPLFYAIIIVVHNQLNTPDEHFCPPFKCANFGWDIEHYSEAVQLYCCHPTPQLKKKLRIGGIIGKATRETFNLNETVMKYDSRGEPVVQNISQIINTNTFNDLIEQDDDDDYDQ